MHERTNEFMGGFYNNIFKGESSVSQQQFTIGVARGMGQISLLKKHVSSFGFKTVVSLDSCMVSDTYL